MKRRKFFHLATSGIAGLALTPSCQMSPKESHLANTAKSGELRLEPPAYRKTIKKSFTGGNIKSANDTVTIALIGAGAWGSHMISQLAKTDENFKLKYICDVDDTRGGHLSQELEKRQGFKPLRVRDMREVFEDKDVDAVFIATPEHWHALATIRACQAGKDVYIEKPVSHTIYEGQKMIEATMKYERIVQCGTFNRSAADLLSARDYINSGELGDLVAVHVKGLLPGPIPFKEKESANAPDNIDWNLWLGPAPVAPYSVSRNKSWFYYWDYGGGYACTNAVIHQLDMARYVLGDPGLPSSVYCVGGRYFFDDNREVPDYQMATFDFDRYVMAVEIGECTPYMEKSGNDVRFGDKFPQWNQNGTRVEILGTRRMMYLGRMGGGWQVLDKKGEIAAQQPGYYPLNAHLTNFFDCIRTREQPISGIVESHRSTVFAHLINLSYRVGCEKLLFSPEYEVIINNDNAQEMALGHYREGFVIPDKV